MDTTSLQTALQHGTISGHIRNVTMITDNAAGLNDAYADGIGIGIGYESYPFHNFQVGISGFFMYNLFSSDLAAIDSATLAPNRYELGLFDVKNPYNTLLNRLENLYLKYSVDNFSIKIGQQLIKPTLSNTIQHYSTIPNNTQHYPTLLNTSQHYPTLPNTSQHYPTIPNTIQHYPTLSNTIQHYPTL
ncbi:MAG: hypothetical protein HYZ54_08715, partial [Ignavibacteriae bacterium]|nr:hypothetical protein [Ignavibacteriota bacterium]